jgi:exosortase E/protease (VPEID-CTERM system)
VLVVAEILCFTIAFDAEALYHVPGTWTRFVAWAPHYLRIAITTVAVAMLISGTAIGRAIRDDKRETSQWPYFAAHLGGLAVFAWVSAIVMDPGFPSRSHQQRWAAMWVGTGVMTLVMWSLAALPRPTWWSVLRRGWIGLSWGMGIAVAAWAGGFLTEAWWQPLARYTFHVVGTILHSIYLDSVSDPSNLVLGTSRFTVVIAPECSGYEGIALVLAFLGVHFWLSRKKLRFPQALLLLPVGAAAIWILNSLRIAALIVIGTSGWPQVALGGFHSQIGWLSFNAVALGLVAMSIRGGYFSTRSSAQPAAFLQCDATLAYIGPFLAIVAVSMLTGAFASGFDWLYPVRVIAAGAALWMFRRHYVDLRWRWSWSAVVIGALAFVVWLALVPAMPGGEERWRIALSEQHWWVTAMWIVSRVVGAVVTVPLAEELAFRGFLLRRLMRTDFDRIPVATFSWWPLLVSSLCFGALHGRFWLAGTAAGALFAIALYRGKALGDAVLAHATTNALLGVYVMATGQWSVW